MSDSLISYWEAWLNDEIKIPMDVNGYVINYSMINIRSNEGIGDWICCNSKSKLISFIKFVLLPSFIVTKFIGIKENKLFFDVSSYDETLEILEEDQFEDIEEAKNEYEACFKELDKLEKIDADWKEIRDFLQYINNSIDFREGLLVNFQVYKNIKAVGKDLIEEYEGQNMLSELEREFDMNKEEIVNLFDGLDKNKFMLQKIGTLLNNKMII